MVRQERAARTRAALVRAAAEEIDRRGYDGTSLNKVISAAGISMGALTFHFSTKSDLADEVQSQGSHAARTVADHVTAGSGPALQAVIDLTLELARLLEEDPVVRSAARLARERPGSPAWSAAWLPAVHSLLAQAQRDGQLHPAVLPETIAALVVHLVAGTETYARARSVATDTARASAVVQLGRIWQLALSGISPREPSDGPPAPRS
ncbi:ScbR family autoregulator-binding transcription factor [Streptomyces celluloflavus]